MSVKWERSQTQVVLRDLEAWLTQLYTEHRVRCELTVSLPLRTDGISSGVSLLAYRVRGDGRRDACHTDWCTVSDVQSGCIEKAALQMVSKLLLALDNEKALAERQTSLWT